MYNIEVMLGLLEVMGQRTKVRLYLDRPESGHDVLEGYVGHMNKGHYLWVTTEFNGTTYWQVRLDNVTHVREV